MTILVEGTTVTCEEGTAVTTLLEGTSEQVLVIVVGECCDVTRFDVGCDLRMLVERGRGDSGISLVPNVPNCSDCEVCVW